jgi:hypothetical protein
LGRIVNTEQEVANPCDAEKQVRRFSRARDAARPGCPIVLETIKPALSRRFGFAAQLGARERIRREKQEIGVAAVAVAERKIADPRGSLPKCHGGGAHSDLRFVQNLGVVREDSMESEARETDAWRQMFIAQNYNFLRVQLTLRLHPRMAYY